MDLIDLRPKMESVLGTKMARCQKSSESNWYNDHKLEGIVLGRTLKFVGLKLDASRSTERRTT